MKSQIENLQIRPLHPDDAAGLYEVVSQPQVARMLVQLPSMEFSETLEWMQKRAPGRHYLVAEVNGRVAGSISLNQYQHPRLLHSGRLGMMVHPDFWNQGIGSRLLAAALEVADNWLNLRRVELDVFTHNPAAIHLYEKFGFTSEGIRRCVTFGDGRFLDEHLMARLRGGAEEQGSQGSGGAGERRSGGEITNLQVRPIHPDDAPALHRLWSHPAVDRTTMQMPTMDYTAAAERVKNYRPGVYRFVAAVEGEAIGMVALHQSQNPRLNHAAGLGMMVHPNYWGQGVGSALMAAVIDLADNWLNLKRVDLDVNSDNPAGIRLYEKFGFVREGTKRRHVYGDGRWADSHFMARVRE